MAASIQESSKVPDVWEAVLRGTSAAEEGCQSNYEDRNGKERKATTKETRAHWCEEWPCSFGQYCGSSIP